MSSYLFTNNWFEIGARKVWDVLLSQFTPAKILEVGSYEGASSCYLIDKLGQDGALEIHCVDTWGGGVEHQEGGSFETNMNSVEARFMQNIDSAMCRSPNKVELVVHKEYSDVALAKLIAEGKKGYFDFVYIDGSHQAPDVLCDAVLGFQLLKIGGYMVFDDYLWAENLPGGMDPLRCPKPAIDAFLNINCRKLIVLSAPLYQIYIQKIAD